MKSEIEIYLFNACKNQEIERAKYLVETLKAKVNYIVMYDSTLVSYIYSVKKFDSLTYLLSTKQIKFEEGENFKSSLLYRIILNSDIKTLKQIEKHYSVKLDQQYGAKLFCIASLMFKPYIMRWLLKSEVQIPLGDEGEFLEKLHQKLAKKANLTYNSLYYYNIIVDNMLINNQKNIKELTVFFDMLIDSEKMMESSKVEEFTEFVNVLKY